MQQVTPGSRCPLKEAVRCRDTRSQRRTEAKMLERGTSDVTLVNCTQDDLYVMVGDALVLLPVRPAPNAVAATRTSSPLLVATKEGSAGVILETGEGSAVTLNAPEEAPQTLYVVTPEVLAQFPHRSDFVAVAAYKYGALQSAGDEAADQQVVVLTRLMTSLAVASPHSVNFTGVAAP